jgi:hypothetical protein
VARGALEREGAVREGGGPVGDAPGWSGDVVRDTNTADAISVPVDRNRRLTARFNAR